MQEIRETLKEVLVLDSGDLLFKKFIAPLPDYEEKEAAEKAHLIIEALNLIHYDAFGIGDDDLTLGKDFLVELSKKANFPFLSSNLYDRESGKPLFQPYLLKEVGRLRIGIFSLLSPDLFRPEDPRLKGLEVKPPLEVAETTIKELQSKADLVILLSHLGYPKDVELAQVFSGIHIIVGSHTGINLLNPPVIKNTVILQTPSKGMYLGRFDLKLKEPGSSFYNITTKQTLERNLTNVRNRLASRNATETEKAQWQKTREGFEKQLEQLKGRNEFSNVILPLTEQTRDHPEIARMVEIFKGKATEAPKPSIPKKSNP